MIWLIIANAFLTAYLVVDATLHILGRKHLKANSEVFNPRYSDIWREATTDWLQDEKDARPFTDFFTDTVALIRYAQSN